MWYTKSYVDGKVSSVKLPATKSVTSRRTKTLCGVCRLSRARRKHYSVRETVVSGFIEAALVFHRSATKS